ncbi:hypothetical protein [Piscinibacter koreensis]|uniref:Uncharacterized protein n=1 Tax=Piscinibacter koreensis TaxID=2742824 RepID=A0A7Y6NRC6_9BURK|nr:hypothetical protein [Schlegelella koreensis]NUZ07886.1 hypothetical protein [Schlegelella koreensis]
MSALQQSGYLADTPARLNADLFFPRHACPLPVLVDRSLCWLATRSLALPEVLKRLRLDPLGPEPSEAHPVLFARQFDTGWVALVARARTHRIVSTRELARLSERGQVLTCSFDERWMTSESELWMRGARRWRIEHDGRRSRDHLVTAGTLPPAFHAIHADWSDLHATFRGTPADMDYHFEIPLAVAGSYIGFRHQEFDRPSDADQRLVEAALSEGRVQPRSRWMFWR